MNSRDKNKYDIFDSNFVAVFEQDIGISYEGLKKNFEDMPGACFENPNDETDKLYLNLIKWAKARGFDAEAFEGYTTPDGKHIRGFFVAPDPTVAPFKQGLDSLANENSHPLDGKDRRKLKEILHDGYMQKLYDFCTQYEEILNLSRSLLSANAKDFTDSLVKIEKTIVETYVRYQSTIEELKQQSEPLKKEIIRFYDLLGKKTKNANVKTEQMHEIQAKSLKLLRDFPLSASEKSNAEKNIRELAKAVQSQPTIKVEETGVVEAKKKPPVVVVDSKADLETVKERIKSTDEYLKHLNKRKIESSFIKGKQHNVKVDEIIKIVTGSKAILENNKDSAAEKIIKFETSFQNPKLHFVYMLELDDFCMQYQEILNLSRSLLSADVKDFTDSLEKIKKNILGYEAITEELAQQTELLEKEIIRFFDLLGKKTKNANVETEQMHAIQAKSLALLSFFPLSASEKANAEKNIRELAKAVQNQPTIKVEETGVVEAKKKPVSKPKPIEVTKPKEEPIKPAVFATVTVTQREEAKPSKPPVASDENKTPPVVIVDSKENLETVRERIKACEEYLKHLNKSKNTSTFIKGKQHNVKADEKIKIVTGLKAILENKKGSAAEKIIKFDTDLQSKSKGFVTSLKKHRDSHLIRFLKYVGVVGAAIIGLAGLGVGAFFAGKAAKEKLFNVKGEEFVSQVTKKR